MPPTAIVAYLVLFATVGFLFVFACLLLGRFLRANSPTPVKLDVYECGEPAVGPGTVQFDLRFYVVALVFLIFEVEVALFFPTATIFGKAIQLLNPNVQLTSQTDGIEAETNGAVRPNAVSEKEGVGNSEEVRQQLSKIAKKKYQELGVPEEAMPSHESAVLSAEGTPPDLSKHVRDQCGELALAAMLDLGAFFVVLLVGFAFVWSRGDLDWVRAIRHPPTPVETAALVRRLRSDISS
jgi:NADH-quinone oxidoreductase subunit A